MLLVNKELVDISDLDDLLFFSFRYTLGRRTYAVGVISELLIKYRLNLAESTAIRICNEIEEAIADNQAGDDCDEKDWRRVLSSLEKIVDYNV